MIKETYVLGMFPNGMVRPCVILRSSNPFLSVGEKIITDHGNAVCLTKEVGRYDIENPDPVTEIAAAMDLGRDLLPKVLGTITETRWEIEEDRRQEYEE